MAVFIFCFCAALPSWQSQPDCILPPLWIRGAPSLPSGQFFFSLSEVTILRSAHYPDLYADCRASTGPIFRCLAFISLSSVKRSPSFFPYIYGVSLCSYCLPSSVIAGFFPAQPVAWRRPPTFPPPCPPFSHCRRRFFGSPLLVSRPLLLDCSPSASFPHFRLLGVFTVGHELSSTAHLPPICLVCSASCRPFNRWKSFFYRFFLTPGAGVSLTYIFSLAAPCQQTVLARHRFTLYLNNARIPLSPLFTLFFPFSSLFPCQLVWLNFFPLRT